MKEQVEIKTERLVLKGITPEFIHNMFNSRSTEEIVRYFNVDETEFARLKGMHEKGMETDRISHLYFLLIDKENNLPIGDCGFHTWNRFHNRAELFYVLRDERYKRKGLMKEALSAVLNFGFSEMGLHRIQGMVAEWNTPSVKLLKHYGFTFEGNMREDYLVDGKYDDSHCYSLLKHEWKSRI